MMATAMPKWLPLAAWLVWLAGCTTQPSAPPAPLQATWYLQQSNTDAEPILYIAVLNRAQDTQSISALVLNGRAGTDEGWRMSFDPAISLLRGGLLVRQAKLFEQRTDGGVEPRFWPVRCQLPASIFAELKPGQPVTVMFNGQMPSALPQGWEECPVPSADR